MENEKHDRVNRGVRIVGVLLAETVSFFCLLVTVFLAGQWLASSPEWNFDDYVIVLFIGIVFFFVGVYFTVICTKGDFAFMGRVVLIVSGICALAFFCWFLYLVVSHNYFRGLELRSLPGSDLVGLASMFFLAGERGSGYFTRIPR